jgi:ribosomal protein S18 acetylase RimI-like enzyme
MKANLNIIQANINNLTSLWQTAAGPFNACFLADDFNYCYIEHSDWPNRLWFEQDITETGINAAKDKLFSSSKHLTVPYWDIYNNNSQELLQAIGLKEKSLQTGMSLKLNARPQKQLQLNFERVIDAGQARAWAEIYPEAFGYRISEEVIERSRNVIEFYMATHQGEPAGTAIVYQTGDIVGVHGVGILPEQRRQGFAEEIMEFALNRAVALGASHVTLQASAMGKGLYDKLGFREDFIIKNYIPV